MKTKAVRKLVLAKETMRLMTDVELTKVAGATFVYSICSCDNSAVVDCPEQNYTMPRSYCDCGTTI